MPEIKVTDEKGITHVFPDGSTPEMIAKAMKVKYNGPAPASTPPASTDPMLPNGELRASPTLGENVASFFRHPLNSMEAASQRRSRPSDASIPEMAATDLYNFGAGATSVARHPIRTVGGIFSQGLGARPVVEGLANYVSQQLGGKRLYDPAPIIPSSPEDAAYAGGQMFATAGLAKAGELGVGKVADAVHTPKGTSTTIPRVLRPLVEKTREAQKAATESADEYANAIKQKTGEIAADQSEKSKAAKAKGIEQERTHQKSVEETKAANKAAIREQEKIAPTKEKLQKSVQEMQAQVETARNNALKEGNKKYNGVNSALNTLEADPLETRKMTGDARSVISDERGKLPTLLKDFDDRVNGTSVTGAPNGPLTYDELQRWYSKFGNEISKGTLPGEEFHAYDKLHEALGEEMQRIADLKGQGAALRDARSYWRRMKQTFGRSADTIKDRAGKALNTANPAYTEEQSVDYWHRLLGSFDPEIPKILDKVSKAQGRLDKLPSEEAARKMKAEVPRAPEAPTIEPPKTKLVPSPRAALQPPEPKQPPSARPPLEREEKPVPPPRPPLEFTPKKVTAGDIFKRNKESMEAKSERLRTGKSPLLTSISVFDAIRNAMTGDWRAVGLDLGARGAYEVGKQGLSALLRNPDVVKFFSKPTAAQIREIPPNLRGPDLQPILDEAKRQGIKVDPRIYAIAGAAAPKKTPGDLLRQAQ